MGIWPEMMQEQPINILLVTSSQAVIEAVAGVLGRSTTSAEIKEPFFRTASSLEEAAAMIEAESPDVCLIDTALDEEHELEYRCVTLRERYRFPLVLISPGSYKDISPALHRIRPFDFLPRQSIADQLGRLLRLLRERQELLSSIQEERKRHEWLIDIAAATITASRSELDQVIDTLLRQLAEELNVDTASLWQFSDNFSSMSTLRKWPRGDHEGGYSIKTVRVDAVPWITGKLQRGETFGVASLQELPPEAEGDHRELAREKIQSFAAAPMPFGDRIFGFLVVRSYEKRENPWRTSELNYLKQAARVLGGALGRKRREEGNSERLHMLEGDVRDAEAKFHNVIESLMEGIVIADPEGVIRYTNNRFAQITGFEKREIIGKRIFEIFFPEEVRSQDAEVQQQYQEYARRMYERYEEWRHGIAEQFESHIYRRDGEERWLEVKAAPLRDKLGKIIGSIAVNADITEQRMLEDQLRWSQKMEAVGRLAGGVAHDFNNLLTVISGYAGMLLRGMDPSDRQYRRVEAIREAGEAACSLTQQLLTVSRRQVVQPKVLDLNEVVTYTTGIIQGLIGEGIQLKTNLSPGLSSIKIDPGQIQQVIMNLAVNARDAMPQGGTLKIRTHEHLVKGDERLLPTPLEPGVYVVLTVSDTGSGMNEATKAHLFEPFFTTKKGGTGLGLSTIYGIVKQAGGSIAVSSEPDAGTSFTIFLPQAEEEAVALGSDEQQEQLPGNETVLVVEDEEHLRLLVREVLEGNGYRVLEAPHGGIALEILAEKGEAIDLLLTDVVMPHLNGIELAEKVKSSKIDIRILLMSGCTHDAAIPDSIVRMGLAFLPKPFTPEVLAAKVREVLDADESSSETEIVNL